MYLALNFFALAISSLALALQHPSCIQKQADSPEEASSTVESTQEVKPFINFTDKKILKNQTSLHRRKLYTKLVQEGIPSHIAKYVFRLNFIERPTIDYANQPEFKFTLESYARKFINRSQRAKNFLEHHLKTFLEVEKKYGVDKEAIVSLMLLESNLGENKGQLNILDALFTMSHPYNSSRTSFFEGEFIAAFKLLTSNEYFFRNNTMGSWAGAMGFIQFIPSSVLAYAVDGNDDGMIDIINNKADAIHSAANYLKKAKWIQGQKIMQEVDYTEIKGFDICQALNQPYKGGILVLQELDPDRYFIVYDNYKTILRWNRSFAFAYGIQSVMNEI